jgi:PLP dependent protein
VTPLLERLNAIQSRIRAACKRAGRPEQGVTLVAVTKRVDPGRIREAFELGLSDFGENYLQEAMGKIETLPSDIHWHMIGHIQSNKAKLVPGFFEYAHSIDRPEILKALDRQGKPLKILFEVNLSLEETKHGSTEDALKSMLEHVLELQNLEPVGLMTMPPFVDDPEEVRPYFVQLRSLLDTCNREFGLSMRELSMGMSQDFEVAIEEGATMVRIGTALFGERQ